jgi:4-hydroxybenzoyl-CoA reductase subunit alpha
VVKVLTHKDIPGNKFFSETEYPQQILAIDKVRFIGDPVAVVFAENEKLAYEAMKFIKVDYEILPTLDTMEKAMALDAVRVHEEHPNLYSYQKIQKGNVEKALPRCDYVAESDFQTSALITRLWNSALPMPIWRGWPNHPDCTGQSYPKIPAEVAAALNISQNDLHYISRQIGGGFGGREDCTTISIPPGCPDSTPPVRVVYSAMKCWQPAQKHPFKFIIEWAVPRMAH